MHNKIFVFLLSTYLFFSFNCSPLFGNDMASTVTYHVGELGEDWQFPSDHLPVGLTAGNIHIAAWNVLNTRFIYHILTNQQGLKESLIVSANLPMEDNGPLTLRENLIIDQVLEMIHHPTHPRSLISLQEVDLVFFEELNKKLPANMICVTTFPNDLADGDIFIYDSTIFEWNGLRSGNYQVRPRNTFMTLSLKEIKTGLLYHFVQSHLPAAPGISSQARKELAQEILSHFDPHVVTVVMGDMNRSPDYLLHDFAEVAKVIGMRHQPLKNLWIPYATHVDCYRKASWFDNLFFHVPNMDIKIEVSSEPETFFSGLIHTVNLMRSLRPHALEMAFEVWCKMKARGVTVVYGPPVSGKKEQVVLALKNEKVRIYNLRDEFLKQYYLFHDISDGKIQKEIKNDYYTTNTYHDVEFEWLNNRSIQISEELLSSDAEVIIFDNFDLSINVELTPYKLSTLLTISSMAKRILENGKKLMFIVHDQALESPLFWEELSQQMGICPQDVIKTKSLIPQEENYLLNLTNLSEDEKRFYQSWCSGIPAAYVTIMEFALDERQDYIWITSLPELMHASTHKVQKIWKKLQKTHSVELIQLLKNIAFRNSFEWDQKIIPEIDLIKTGLVAKKNGQIHMPTIVCEVIKSL